MFLNVLIYPILFFCLVILGKQESVEAVLVAIQAVPEPFSSFASVLLQICAYAGNDSVEYMCMYVMVHTGW